eukprot:CAMPEP_0119344618 /NCGR_PEP_ID=MMETSP1333-20130426/107062_1 /TAXON_ID=418940 /ORGANISM="Scyphosphaera apsteinii, Strain RCC1455" /LENGTH=330 /DNA_ID=CAMNT_0007357059 /DNA_START=94 /DNA_END=1083 /DNA_ORIENTATION=-
MELPQNARQKEVNDPQTELEKADESELFDGFSAESGTCHRISCWRRIIRCWKRLSDAATASASPSLISSSLSKATTCKPSLLAAAAAKLDCVQDEAAVAFLSSVREDAQPADREASVSESILETMRREMAQLRIMTSLLLVQKRRNREALQTERARLSNCTIELRREKEVRQQCEAALRQENESMKTEQARAKQLEVELQLEKEVKQQSEAAMNHQNDCVGASQARAFFERLSSSTYPRQLQAELETEMEGRQQSLKQLQEELQVEKETRQQKEAALKQQSADLEVALVRSQQLEEELRAENEQRRRSEAATKQQSEKCDAALERAEQLE